MYSRVKYKHAPGLNTFTYLLLLHITMYCNRAQCSVKHERLLGELRVAQDPRIRSRFLEYHVFIYIKKVRMKMREWGDFILLR